MTVTPPILPLTCRTKDDEVKSIIKSCKGTAHLDRIELRHKRPRQNLNSGGGERVVAQYADEKIYFMVTAFIFPNVELTIYRPILLSVEEISGRA